LPPQSKTLLLLAFLCTLFLALCTSAASPSPLADAVEKSDRPTIRALLKQHTDPNAPQIDGTTALHWAAYLDDLETARLLLKAGANATATNLYGVAPLSLVCANGNGPLVEALLDAGADPNTGLPGNETALMTAARTGRPGPVKALLARGAKVDDKEHHNQTALMWAAADGHTEVVELLLKAGADVHATLSGSGFSPLTFAVREGRMDAARVLLKAGADVNAAMHPHKTSGKNVREGTTPLVLAVENGHFDLAVTLLEAGANPNDQRSGFAPLHVLTWARKPPRGDGDDGDPPPTGSGKLTSLQFAKKLVEHGAQVNARLDSGKSGRGILTRKGATPFLLAAATADTTYMKLLVELGADPSIPNAQHCSALLAACGVGSLAPSEEAGTEPEVLEAVEYCLSLGLDINAVDDNGETAMHGAAYKNLPLVVKLLASKGAKPQIWNTFNKWHWTPLLIAQGHRVGNFKPSFETVAALTEVMQAAGITMPTNAVTVETEAPSEYAPAHAKKIQ
jgi:ankyrin repeat protein